MSLTFTFATIADLPAIVAIYNQAIPSRQATADLEPVSVESRLDWFYSHQPQTRPLWVIKRMEEIVGWMSLSDFYGRKAYQKTAEVSIYLAETEKNKGTGRAALTFLEQTITNFDIDTIVAYIFGHNLPSQQLFRRFGYMEWGHLPAVAELDEKKCDLKIFGKQYRKE